MLDEAHRETASPEAGPPPDLLPAGGGTFRALRHRNYRLYFSGQLVSLIGTWMQQPALSWLTYELTRESRWPAWITAAQLLPTFLFGLWGGKLADRWPRRRLLLVTQTILLLLPGVLILLVQTGVQSPWPYLGVATLTGLILAVDFPTRLAFVMDMVGRADLANAVALNALMFNAARLVGPMLAGEALTLQGPQLCFAINSVSYLAMLAALLTMDVDGAPLPATGTPRQALSGFAQVAGDVRLLAVLFLAGLMGFCGWPFLNLLPAVVAKVLGAGASGYTQMLSATGLGALGAALTAATFGQAWRNRYFILGGVGLVCTGLLGLALADGWWVAFGSCFLMGFGLILFFATGQAVLQLAAAEHNRGQVLGIWAMVVSGAQPLGNLLAGPAGDEFGEQRVLAALALILAGAATLTALLFVCWRRGQPLAAP
jgi:MFS family permease